MARDWTAVTLGDRIKALAAHHGVSLNKLGEKAGIKSGPMSRLAAKKAVVASSPETLRKLAEAWSVSFAWLAFGYGQPSEQDILGPQNETQDSCQSRNVVVAMLRHKKVDSSIIEALLREKVPFEDPGEEHWIARVGELLKLSAKLDDILGENT